MGGIRFAAHGTRTFYSAVVPFFDEPGLLQWLEDVNRGCPDDAKAPIYPRHR